MTNVHLDEIEELLSTGRGLHEVVEEEVALEVVSLSQAGNRVQSISHELLAIVFGLSP